MSMRLPAAVCLSMLVLVPSLASAQTPAAGEFQVNTYTTGDQDMPAISQDSQGNYVVVWQSQQEGTPDIFARRFDAAGAPLGDEFRVNTYTTGVQRAPAISHFPNGDFVVAWGGQSPVNNDVQAQRFAADGSRVGAEFVVNTETSLNEGYPSVSADASGFVVAWQRPDGGFWGVSGQRFGPAGDRVGSEFQANTYTTNDQWDPSVASHADGSFVVVWWDTHQEVDNGIFGRRFTAAGVPVGGEFHINTYTTSAQTFPSVTAAPDGGFVVAWQSWQNDGNGYGIAARRYSASGAPAGDELVLNADTALNQSDASVGADAQGNLVAVWRTASDGSSSGIRGRRFTSGVVARGDEFQVNTYTTGQQWTARFIGNAVAVDDAGNFVVAWRSFGQDGDGYGIFTQRFGGLRPAALRAGADGNGVVEPGETADLRPSWRNENGLAQAFGGALRSFTGPAGATYGIVDGSASYGTVANGTVAECIDCYTVAVTNPPARPAVHWDAVATEGIVPDGHGQQKAWPVHIGASFVDVPTSNPFYRFVETLLHRGVTGGCSATQYCPLLSTSRAQMAVFALVAKQGPGYQPPACGVPMFTDVLASNPFCPFIEELVRRGVVSGCGNGMYCPEAPVTREQMSIFALRTLDPVLDPPACVAGSEMFADVPAGSPFCRWVEELARRGVVGGCGGGNYCPGAPVTREQMGVFISATFGLTLYGT